jgi:hypothetical protein
MAAITFDVAGDELAQLRAENPSPLEPIASGGRVRIKKFSIATASSGQQVELAEFGKNVAIVGGAVTGGTGVLDVGWTATGSPVDTTKDVFLDGLTTGVFEAYQVTTTEATTVFATANATLTSKVGYILYVENS